ncbi:hypothetical protein Gogos_016870 [Gossypium gossypioides]|uniref:Uncharacterized protein n=1 Tax=Gossypium gossypioides TaxID=34282 RepID=A0A7J9BB30_GOSGO|nr:hypothetical protein [Gossypium gossypioides]
MLSKTALPLILFLVVVALIIGFLLESILIALTRSRTSYALWI